jgi:hypothetical protein
MSNPGVSGVVDAHDGGIVERAGDLGDALQGLLVGDHGARAAVAEAVAQGLGAEQPAERDGDGAELPHREVREAGLEPLRQHDSHALPRSHTDGAQAVGEAIGEGGQIPEGALPDRTAGRDLDKGEVAGGMGVGARHAHVELGGQLPGEGVAELRVRRLPAPPSHGPPPRRPRRDARPLTDRTKARRVRLWEKTPYCHGS